VSFISGLPDLSLFPRRGWNKAYSRALEYARDEEFTYGSPRGNALLREVLAGFLFRSKGIRARPDNIIITSGAAQAISLLAHVMSRSGRRIIPEDPLVSFVYEIFSAYGFRPDFADVDEEGIVPDSISARGASLIYVSPSHQFPLGGTLSARRRIQLLSAIAETDCFIIEDDYDGEFRYGSRPIAPLQVLAPERVIYIGTFSKNLAPALRLGYMVVPDQLLDRLKKLKRLFDLITEGLSQLAMARFINEGLLERHIARMRKIYQKRKEMIEELLLQTFGDSVEIRGQTTGLHLVLRFPGCHFKPDMPGELLKKGLKVEPVSPCGIRTKAHGDKLVLGYGQVKEQEITKGVAILKEYIAGIKS
jgi:GntR family transcriptional regulator/MocR family aminotransferase